MKAFFISTVIFFVMSAVIIFNFIYINNVADRLLELTDAITPNAVDLSDKVFALEDFWEKNKSKMDLTTNHIAIGNIGIKISNIRLFADYKDFFQLEKEVLLLREEIKEMRRLERFSVENIF